MIDLRKVDPKIIYSLPDAKTHIRAQRNTFKFVSHQFIPNWSVLQKNAKDRIAKRVQRSWDRHAKKNGIVSKPSEKEFDFMQRWHYFRWLARTNLFWFAQNVLGSISTFEDLAYLHYCLSGWDYTTRDQEEKAVYLGRGHFKTTFLLLARCLQMICNDPGIRIAIMIPTEPFGRRNVSKPIQSHFVSNKALHSLFPEIFTPEERLYPAWRAMSFSCLRPTGSKEGSTIEIITPNTSDTGFHYDTCHIDDLVTQKNCKSTELREQITEAKEYMQPKVDPVSGWCKTRFYNTATIYHYDDTNWRNVIPKLLDNDYEKIREFKNSVGANISDKIFYCPTYILDKNGGKHYVFPERFNDKEIEKLRASMSKQMFSSQYLLKPLSDEDKEFPPPYDNRFYNLKEDGTPIVPSPLTIVIAVDWAGERVTKRGDESVIQVVGKCAKGIVWDLAHDCGNWHIDELISRTYKLAEKYKPVCIGFEQNSMFLLKDRFVELMRANKRWFEVKELVRSWVDGSKEQHILHIQYYWKTNKIRIHPKHFKLLGQLAEFPNSAHDDHPDAFAHAVRMRELKEPVEKAVQNPRTVDNQPYSTEPIIRYAGQAGRSNRL